MAGATALDQLEGGIHLVGAVDRQVDAIDGVEALQGDAQFSGQHLALEGGGDAGDVPQLAASELGAKGLDHQGGGGARTQADDHAALDLLGGGGRHGLLHLILQIRHPRLSWEGE